MLLVVNRLKAGRLSGVDDAVELEVEEHRTRQVSQAIYIVAHVP